MNRIIIASFVSLVLLFASVAKPPEVNILSDRGSSITVEFKISGYDIEPVEINGNTSYRIVLPNCATYMEKGYPELPVINKSIIIPDDGLMSYRILSVEEETKLIGKIIPSKGNLYRNINPEDVPYTFGKIYDLNTFWPGEIIQLSEPFILRDYRGLSIRFNPFRYNPKTGELKVIKRIVVEVYESGKGGVNVLNKPHGAITREFLDIYETVFLNFNETRYDSITERAGRMLIITADAYMSNMQPFKTWKRQKGIQTKMVPISVVGNTPTNIKNYIQNEYNQGGLVWVLLVGDGNEVVPGVGTIGAANGADADPVYAYCAGSDYYPDIYISRFSSRGGNAVNIDKQVSRSINYEKTPQTGANWYNIGLGVASNQGTPADSTRCNWLRDSLLTPKYYYTAVNKSYDSWGTTQMIKNFIEAGTSIINYIGHGSTTSWVNGGGFTNNDLLGLNNPWKLPFVISVACVVGNFDGNDCYCEVSVTVGTVENPNGFLAHWGSTINQSWVPPCIGQEGAVNLLTHNKKNTFGGLCFNGACYMIDYYGPTNAAGIEMAQTWHIFGDASVQVRTNTPQAMTVNHPSSINIGQTTFSVSVPNVGAALVGLYIDTLLVGSGYTNSAGNVTITLNPPPSAPGTMYITVTAYNKIPYLGSVPIVSSSGPYILLGRMILNDSGGNGQVNPGETVNLGVYGKNVGSSAAQGVYGKLTESDPYVSISIDSSWYGNIPVNDSVLGAPYYRFTVANNCPNNYNVNFTLTFKDASNNTWTSNPVVTVYAPVLTYQSVAVTGGNGNGILDPGETANLVVTIKNEGGAVASNV
ncbi:MAG: C25 family cysteine peptidase, partial [candidate division WOR-3 bacterium]